MKNIIMLSVIIICFGCGPKLPDGFHLLCNSRSGSGGSLYSLTSDFYEGGVSKHYWYSRREAIEYAILRQKAERTADDIVEVWTLCD